MVPHDRFLQGLFAPNGGLTLPKPKPINVFTEFAQWLHAAIKRVMAALSKPFMRKDYALCI